MRMLGEWKISALHGNQLMLFTAATYADSVLPCTVQQLLIVPLRASYINLFAVAVPLLQLLRSIFHDSGIAHSTRAVASSC